MKRDEKITLIQIAHAAQLVEQFLAEMDHAVFMSDERTHSAVLYQILVLGEAVKRLPMEFRSKHPHIPWSRMAGMRDKLIHGYDLVNLEEVWKAAKVAVPDPLERLKPLLPVEAP